MTDRLVTPPSVEPITLAEAKLFLRVTNTAQDDLISSLITVAREYGENYTRRAFVPQERELTLDWFPGKSAPEVEYGFGSANAIEIPRPPLQSVQWIKYVDVNGNEQTVDSSIYQVDTYRQPGAVKPKYLQFWPLYTVRGDFNAVMIRYTAGYSVGSPVVGTLLPESIKTWMKQRIAMFYDNRQPITSKGVNEIPRAFIDGLLDPYVVNLF